jgi:hypothetical protein
MTPWAEEFDVRAKAAIDTGDAPALMAYEKLTPGALTAVPFPDHYFPLLYAMGAAQPGDKPRHVYEGFQAGTCRCAASSGADAGRAGREACETQAPAARARFVRFAASNSSTMPRAVFAAEIASGVPA